MNKDQINRINELAKKQRREGLTEEEQQEQQHLRKLYIQAMKQDLESQLKGIKYVGPEHKPRKFPN